MTSQLKMTCTQSLPLSRLPLYLLFKEKNVYYYFLRSLARVLHKSLRFPVVEDKEGSTREVMPRHLNLLGLGEIPHLLFGLDTSKQTNLGMLKYICIAKTFLRKLFDFAERNNFFVLLGNNGSKVSTFLILFSVSNCHESKFWLTRCVLPQTSGIFRKAQIPLPVDLSTLGLRTDVFLI